MNQILLFVDDVEPSGKIARYKYQMSWNIEIRGGEDDGKI